MDLYRQCKLRSDNVEQTAWIPAHLAIQGKSIQYYKLARNWQVVECYGYRVGVGYGTVDGRGYAKEFGSLR